MMVKMLNLIQIFNINFQIKIIINTLNDINLNINVYENEHKILK